MESIGESKLGIDLLEDGIVNDVERLCNSIGDIWTGEMFRAPSKELAASRNASSATSSQLSSYVHMTADGMRVTANDSVSVFGGKLCLSNRRDVRQLARNVLHVLVLGSRVLDHGIALQLPHVLRSQVLLHERFCEPHQIDFPSSLSLLATANFGTASPAAANNADR